MWEGGANRPPTSVNNLYTPFVEPGPSPRRPNRLKLLRKQRIQWAKGRGSASSHCKESLQLRLANLAAIRGTATKSVTCCLGIAFACFIDAESALRVRRARQQEDER